MTNEQFQQNVLQALAEHSKILQEHSKILLDLKQGQLRLEGRLLHLEGRVEDGFADTHEWLELHKQSINQAFERISALS